MELGKIDSKENKKFHKFHRCILFLYVRHLFKLIYNNQQQIFDQNEKLKKNKVY